MRSPEVAGDLVKRALTPVSYRDPVTSVEVVLVLAGVPLAIMVVLGLLTLRPKFARTPRYRPGEPWNHPPVLWTANPEAARDGAAHHGGHDGSGESRGGARGHW
ncbi:MAG: hypothetical protein WAK86_12085 [Pseudonocardiaceae bacterium]